MGKKSEKRAARAAKENRLQVVEKSDRQRDYRGVVSVGGDNGDWIINQLTNDSDVWQNSWLLTARARDLFKTNPVLIKYRELLWSNVFGANGIMLRMKIKETEDRVVSAPAEKWAIIAHERKINQLRKWAERKTGSPIDEYRLLTMADRAENCTREDIISGRAMMIQVGDPDVYACLRVESGWKQWQRAEFCDLRKTRDYKVLRQLRLLNGARDGDVFIRKIMDPKVNKFGFSLQIIAAEWCDRFYNTVLTNGNVVIMGIEYKMSDWGIGEPVAYYFIKRQPMDWQFSIPGAFNFTGAALHTRIDASEIIHYARPDDGEGTRPAPWVSSVIPSSRQLDQAMIAEVVAWRESACKVGFLYSDIMPEGGFQGDTINPRNSLPTQPLSPGEVHALEYGVKFQGNDPLHPNSNVEQFRKTVGRQITAGLPGGDYNILFSDLENINFSAGRLGRLDTNEMSMLLQQFDIDTAERPIFEEWLYMALATGAIPLPLAKFDKYNKPVFNGRRWRAIDEVKEVTASALRIANKLSNRSSECADEGVDFEENAFELAEEEMLLESLGMSTQTTVEGKTSQVAPDTEGEDELETEPPAKTPATEGED